jgi:hypothetical protein
MPAIPQIDTGVRLISFVDAKTLADVAVAPGATSTETGLAKSS